MAGNSGGAPLVISSDKKHKPTGFIDAISQIERNNELERQGSDIPMRLFTTGQKLEFWEVGCKSTLWSGIISILITPLAIGVIEQMIPIFGDINPSMGDQLIALLLAASFAIGYAFFLGRIGMLYDGKYTRIMIRSFLSGVFMSGIFKIVFAMIFYHTLVFVVFTEDRLSRILLMLHNKWFSVSMATLNSWYAFLLDFKDVLILSAYFITVTTTIYITVPYICIMIKKWKKRKYSLECE